jgi:8-oxo-dGTP pyrophosphatase MutT (NUDIX family)
MKIVRPFIVTEVSAGGLVIASHDPSLVALISHRNRGGRADWCLPKGHIEQGENTNETAVREVYEETGLEAEVISKIGEIRYSFRLGPKRIRKTVHHFLMKQVGGELNHLGDPTGEVLAVQWFSMNELNEVLAHENEKKMVTLARELLG